MTMQSDGPSTSVLADYDHPLVKSIAHQLTDSTSRVDGKVERIFYYVRDEIAFFFPDEGDFVKASEILQTKRGQCNTKGTLFLALCKAVEIPARLHFSLISKQIQRGFCSGWSYLQSLVGSPKWSVITTMTNRPIEPTANCRQGNPRSDLFANTSSGIVQCQK